MWKTVLLALAVAGCAGAPKTEERADGTFTIRYQMDAIDSYALRQASLSDAAVKLCPNGWAVLSERPTDDGPFGSYYWNIRCQ